MRAFSEIPGHTGVRIRKRKKAATEEGRVGKRNLRERKGRFSCVSVLAVRGATGWTRPSGLEERQPGPHTLHPMGIMRSLTSQH